jgi:hypothetical protein
MTYGTHNFVRECECYSILLTELAEQRPQCMSRTCPTPLAGAVADDRAGFERKHGASKQVKHVHQCWSWHVVVLGSDGHEGVCFRNSSVELCQHAWGFAFPKREERLPKSEEVVVAGVHLFRVRGRVCGSGLELGANKEDLLLGQKQRIYRRDSA